MTIASMIALFGAMVSLAIIPDASTLAVVARSLGSGLSQALITITGILAGDLIFVLIAVYGLASVADSNLFILVKYLGGAYLVWAGIVLWNSSRKEVKKTTELPARSNFLFGLLITLGDPKAIFFYISFLPVFVDLSRISITDLTIIITLIIIAVGGTKLTYACLADKARIFFKSPQSKKWMNTIAGCVLIVSGVFLILKD
ncbi:MAG: LysE family translocator [Nitrospinaceae bacterium]|nr:LysE family translocator [Nitrospina sp.]MBT5867629.1 LysE family translocator [Nitrospinaceae bacterium]